MKNCMVGATRCKKCEKNIVSWDLRNVKNCIVGATECKEL